MSDTNPFCEKDDVPCATNSVVHSRPVFNLNSPGESQSDSELKKFQRLEPLPDVPIPSGAKTDRGTGVLPSEKVGLDVIAKRLLEDNYLLTALEFYAELVEAGRDCKRLRDFFSNPANFEFRSQTRYDISPNSLGLARASSAQTLDSLDYCQYSDDGKQSDEKIAVLEFELRKSAETIKELRSQLTLITAAPVDEQSLGEPSLPASESDLAPKLSLAIKPHEKKAINFLVNEYLLQNGYKLTGVCFSDEAADQDFDNWDDVGLNVGRPNDLLSLFRQYNLQLYDSSSKNVPTARSEVGCQSDDFDDSLCIVNDKADRNEFFDSLNTKNDELVAHNKTLSGEIQRLNAEVDRLHQLLSNLNLNETKIERLASNQEASSSFSSQTRSDTWSCKRTAPGRFKHALYQSVVARNEESSNFKSCKIAVTPDELSHMLSQALPNLVNNFPVNKREDFISLILSLSALHSDLKARDQLLSLFFRLYKKPDEEQRCLLISGCVSYARHVGSIRTESELLPQCWEQINDKCVERRLLIAEICGALASHLPPALISSLLLSMLRQMLCDDSSELVREAAVKSLALVCCHIEDNDKFQLVADLHQRALTDTTEMVTVSTCQYLTPSLGLWASEIDKLPTIVMHYVHVIQSILTSTNAAANQSANENLLCIYLEMLKRLNWVLFVWAVKAAPFYASVVKSGQPALEAGFNFDTNTDCNNPYYLFSDDKHFDQLKTEFYRHSNEEWYLTWDHLEFVYKELFPALVKMFCKSDCTNLHRLPSACVNYVYSLVKTFGYGLLNSKLKSVFLDNSQALQILCSDRPIDLTYNFSDLTRLILPVYVLGVLMPFYEDPRDTKSLKLILKNSTLVVGILELNATAQLLTFDMLCIVIPDQEFSLSILFELITHKSVSVRKLCASVLSRLIKKLTVVSAKSRALSALITLASDSEHSVRIASLSGFVEFLESDIYCSDLAEKLRMQLSAFFDECYSDVSGGSVEITTHLMRILAQSVPVLEPTFRDEYLLPQLSVLVARNSVCQNAELKQTLAASIFECYSALSCCYSLSQLSISRHFLPGLKSLQKDLDSERCQVAGSILKDLEAKVSVGSYVPSGQLQGKLNPSLAAANETVDVMKSKMFNKFRDFKDKMDLHKETVPKMFGVVKK